ncbi:MAG: spore coat U domain-containing protein [Pseudomonadota bacterium]|nr:spore coat U domain-containing protein [Pseudomonadota bacterium]
MTVRARSAALVAAMCLLSLAGMASAQHRGCVVESAPPLSFGTLQANPTGSNSTSTPITVRCSGNGSEGGATVLVCIRLEPTPGQTTERRMTSGTSALRYEIRGGSPSGPVIAGNQTANATMTLDQGTTSSPTGIVTIPLYGGIIPGQMGLASGTYTEAILGDVRSTTTPAAGCTAEIKAILNTSASAVIAGSCSIVADNLAFGSHSSLAGSINAAAGIRLTCTSNTAYSVGINGGGSGNTADRRMRRDGIGPESIGYGLYRDAGRTQTWGNTPATSVQGTGTGSLVSMTAYGQVPAQPNPLTGDYRDTVVVTVEF